MTRSSRQQPKPPAELRAEIIALFDDAKARALALLDGESPAPVSEPPKTTGAAKVPVIAQPTEVWLGLKAAARELDMHPRTLKRLAVANGFGRRARGSQWRIEMSRARVWRASGSCEPLETAS